MFLRVSYHNDRILCGSWIDNTGLKVYSPLWWYSNSVYLDEKNGIFFIDKKEQRFKGFVEIRNCILVKHLPYSNIVNFDFKEYIDYDAVLYTKYKYDSKKLYSDEIILREKEGTPYQRLELNKNLELKKYSVLMHALFKIKIRITKHFP